MARKRRQSGPKARHRSFNEGVSQSAASIEREAVEVEKAVPLEENESVERPSQPQREPRGFEPEE